MSNQDRTQTRDLLTQAPEPQTVQPEVAPRTMPWTPAHPVHRLQQAAGNRFVQARFARQAEGTAPPQPGPAAEAALRNVGRGRPLPASIRARMENALGADFGDVRIHLDSVAGAAADELNAKAFTVGKDIFFGPGSFAPNSPASRDIIAHELAHTLQPGAGARLDLTQVDAVPPDPLAEQVIEVEEVVAEEPSLDTTPEEVPEVADAAPPEAPPQPEAEAAEKEPAEESEGDEEKAEGEEDGEAGAGAAEAPASARPDIELIMPPAPSELSPESQERVASSQRAARRAGRAVRKLPSAEASTAAARGAVEEPETETTARAESRLAEALGTRPEPSAEIIKLCQSIRESIREKRPVDEDELVEAEPEKMAEAAGSELNESVEGDTKRVQDSYSELNEPQTGTPELDPQEIDTPPEAVATPEIGAEGAAPDAVPPDNVDLSDDLSKVDADIEASGANSETAQAAIGEPFDEMRAARGELGEKAQTRPAEVLARQDEALQQASADMAALQEQALAALSSSRAETVSGVDAQQNRMVGTEQQMREQLSQRSRQIFTAAQSQVNALLRPLPGKAMELWKAGVERHSTTFRQSLDRVKRWIDDRHSGVGGAIVGLWDAVTGLPDWVTEEYDRAEKEFGDNVCDLIIEISAEVNSVIATCEQLIDDARQQIDNLFSQELPEGLREWAAAERERIHGQLDGLQNQVTTSRDDFNRDLSRQAVQAVREVQAEVEQLREEAKGLIGRIADAIGEFLDDPVKAIINGLLRLVGISPASFWALVAKIQQVIDDIADDPKGFVNNLVSAVAQGFQQFFDNFAKHLLEGLLDWLFGGLTSVGVDIPTEFSLKSVITFFLQLMGITWPNIRQILVRHIGEENVALIEKAWEIISTLMEQGPEGIFEMIKERLDPQQILTQVMDAAIDYVIEALIKNVTVRIIALFNPVGAIAQAIELIYKVGKWIFENAARIFSFIETIVNGLADIVAGNIGGMANAVEAALAKLIPPVIDFLASLIGLGDLPAKVVETVKKLQDWVLSILDRVIGWLAEQGKKLLKAVGLGGEEPAEGAAVAEGDTVLGTSVSFSANGESHRQWVDIQGTDAILMVASDGPKPVGDKLAEWESRLDEQFEDNEEGRNEAAGLIAAARALLGQADSEADALVTAFQRANAIREGEELPEIPSDDPLERKQQALSTILGRLYTLFGEEPPETAFAPIYRLVGVRLVVRGADDQPDTRVSGLDLPPTGYTMPVRDDRIHIQRKNADDPNTPLVSLDATGILREGPSRPLPAPDDAKIREYQKVLRAAGIRESNWPTDEKADDYRRNMRRLVVGKFAGNLEELDQKILTPRIVEPQFNRVIGEIFEEWVAANLAGVVRDPRPTFLPATDNKLTQKRVADARMSGNILIEVKAISESRRPSREERLQMQDYATIVGTPGVPWIRRTGDTFREVFFVLVRYVFNNEAVARAWKPDLERFIGDRHETLPDVRRP